MPYIGNPIYQSAFVVDQFSGNGSTTAFTMSVAPAGVTNVLVAVSGVLQDPSTYGVVGNTITFSAAPPSGTGNISCRYLGVPASGVTTTAYRTVTEFTATASQTTFTPPSYTVGFINVYLNGVLLGSADYTATNGTTVVLATGASAGNLLTVESFLVSSVLNAIPNTAGSVLSSNISSGVTINFADGSASTPSITNDGDTNTGIFFPAADTIAFTEGGVESMRVNPNGKLSVGTTESTRIINAYESESTAVAANSFWNLQYSGINLRNTSDTVNALCGIGLYGGSSGNSISAIANVNESLSLGALAFFTGGSGRSNTVPERMRIDSAGRVTMPSQPTFFARGSANLSPASGTSKVTGLSTADINIGSSYNTSTSTFTTPVAGTYQITLITTWNTSGSSQYIGAVLYKNGGNAFSTYSSKPSSVYAQTVLTVNITLSAGDTLEFYIDTQAGGCELERGRTYFMGRLLG